MTRRKIPNERAEAIKRLDDFMKVRPNPFAELLKKQDALRAELIEKHGPDYDKPVMRFEINKAERAVIDAWLEDLKPEIMELQRKNGWRDPLGIDEPYYGSTGGGITYSFIGTSLGDILIVKETTTGKELNVQNALEWIFYG